MATWFRPTCWTETPPSCLALPGGSGSGGTSSTRGRAGRASLCWFCLLHAACVPAAGAWSSGYSRSEGGGQHSGLHGRQPLLQMDGTSGLLIPVLICFTDQIPGTRGWGRQGWEQCRGPGAQPQSRGFVHSYEENTKCINLSIYLHVFLKGSLPEIYPLGKMLLVAGGHQLLYVKNKEKRKKKKGKCF